MSIQNYPQSELPQTSPHDTIIFYDGECGVCDQFVTFCLARDKLHLVKYAPLQGTTASEMLPEKHVRNLQTVVCLTEGKIYTHSSAVVRVFWRLGGIWSCCGTLLYLIPPLLRNLGYRIFARNRFLLMGKMTTCRLISPAERLRFLP